VLGMNGAGKSSLISQFITSEYRNAFADEIEDYENTVSINVDGTECDLIFFEADPLTVSCLLLMSFY
jgi:GTPase SAR1 family protein